MLRVLDLFSGIGGFSLGLERTGGFETVAFCEIDPFCRRVLAKHWPGVKCYEDVRTLDAPTLLRDGIAIDAIAGGFPCQDVSNAGRRAGLAGSRSGLWAEYARLIGELRPRYVFVENVTGLLSDGMGRVLGELAALGYDAFWDCIPASALGAHHQRDRVWLVAHAERDGGPKPHRDMGAAARSQSQARHIATDGSLRCGSHVADADEARRHERPRVSEERARVGEFAHCGWWQTEPNMGRVADGVPGRLDRISALGNAVVPQIPELIGRAVLAAHLLKAARGEGKSDEC